MAVPGFFMVRLPLESADSDIEITDGSEERISSSVLKFSEPEEDFI